MAVNCGRVGTPKPGPLRVQHEKIEVPYPYRTHKDHKNGVCDYCWRLDSAASPTCLDETSAGLSDNPFTEDDYEVDDGAFSKSSSSSSCLEEDEEVESDKLRKQLVLAQNFKGKSRTTENRDPQRASLPPVECEIVTQRRVIRRRVSRPSPLPSLYRASLNSQEAISGSGIRLN